MMEFLIEGKKELWHFRAADEIEIVGLMMDAALGSGDKEEKSWLPWNLVFDAIVILKAGRNHLVEV